MRVVNKAVWALHSDVARTASLLARIRLEMAEQPTTRPCEKQRAAGVLNTDGSRTEVRRALVEPLR